MRRKSYALVHGLLAFIANEDFHQLLIPTIQALATEDVFIVATTGNKPLENVSVPLPLNVKLETFVSHHEWLPHVDMMMTNAGYGGVQMAMHYGVPLVVAGKTEDKPEVCACGMVRCWHQFNDGLTDGKANPVGSTTTYEGDIVQKAR